MVIPPSVSGRGKYGKASVNTSSHSEAARKRARGPFILVAAALGILFGLGGYTMQYAEGLSYFSTDPQACTNCHIMQPQFDSWQKASHHGFATCVDCHLPNAFVAKYIAKAENGYYHSKGFTFQDFHEPITIKESNAEILQENCLACHEPMVEGILASGSHLSEGVPCVHCHATVGHGVKAGLGGPEEYRYEPAETPTTDYTDSTD